MKISFRRRALGVALAATLAVGGVALVQPAVAADADPNRLGDLIATATSGTIDPAAKTGWLTELRTEEGQICPVGFRTRSSIQLVHNGTLRASAIAGQMIAGNSYVGSVGGINDGETSIRRTGDRLSQGTSAFPWGAPVVGGPTFIGTGGTWEIRHTCMAGTQYAPATDKYYSVVIEATPGTGAWRVAANEAVKTATTTTLTASGTTATSTTLSATIAPAAATGAVQFKKDGVNVGGPAAVSNGVATYSVSGLAGATAYSFTAEYSGDTAHEASVSTAVVVTTAAAPAPSDTKTPQIGVTVPAEQIAQPAGLKITTSPTGVTLQGATTARPQGQDWVATGVLGDVTVTDDRRDASKGDWTLSGTASAFKAGTQQFGASNLSWTPAKVSGSGAAGTPSSNLTLESALATGKASGDTNVATTVKADLSLKVPSGTPAGEYASTLTLTLI